VFEGATQRALQPVVIKVLGQELIFDPFLDSDGLAVEYCIWPRNAIFILTPIRSSLNPLEIFYLGNLSSRILQVNHKHLLLISGYPSSSKPAVSFGAAPNLRTFPFGLWANAYKFVSEWSTN
jgi:hypothetical protein